MNEEVPIQVEQVPQDRQGIQGSQGTQVPPQGDLIPNLEGGIEVPEISIRETKEALVAIA